MQNYWKSNNLPDVSAGDDVIQRLKEDMVELTNDASLEEIIMNLHILHFTFYTDKQQVHVCGKSSSVI